MEDQEGSGDKGSAVKKRKLDQSERTSGADYDVPRVLSVTDYAECRIQEIKALTEAVRTRTGSCTPLQQLPKPLRRRAAGYNIKRLPRKTREYAQKLVEREGNAPLKPKRPSRKHCRRPGNLLKEYQRRSRKHGWLETHIWHAKRFKMVEKWGYKIPLHPNDKSSRASYRAETKFCLLQDLSYVVCIEIEGPQKDIINGLSKLCSADTGLTFGAKSYLSGQRQGHSILYKKDSYPYGAIGEVSFMWNKLSKQNSDNGVEDIPNMGNGERHPEVDLCKESGNVNAVGESKKVKVIETEGHVLWLWVHPAAFEEVMTQLVQVFQLKRIPQSDVNKKFVELKKEKHESLDKPDMIEPASKKQKLDGAIQNDKAKLDDWQNDLKMGNPIYANEGITVRSLKDRLCRFRLAGPLSQAVVHDCLVPASVSSTSAEHTKWWQQYFSDSARLQDHQVQQEFWEGCSGCSPAELPPNMVLGLTVRDPRLLLPPKKTNIQATESDDANECKTIPPRSNQSPLWNVKVREEVKVMKMPQGKLNELRSKLLVPGTTLDLGDEESRIPVLLVQRPGVQSSTASTTQRAPFREGSGMGWDLVLPAGWAMPFWVALVYRGARVGALRELRVQQAERRKFHFPDDYPDTLSGKEEEELKCRELCEKYSRKPPAKKPNFVKLGIQSPYKSEWASLINNLSTINQAHPESTGTGRKDETLSSCDRNFYVIRDRKFLKALSEVLNGARATGKQKETTRHPNQELNGGKINSVLEQHQRGLVPVHIEMVHRGSPEEFAYICLPTEEDLNKHKHDKTYQGPVEPVHKDPRGRLKKQEGKKKKRKKKQQDKIHECEEQKMDNQSNLDSQNSASSTGDPQISVISNVEITPCERETIGYIKYGNFSYSTGKGFGLGFVAMLALSKFTTETFSRRTVVLVRNITSHQYRYAYMSVTTDH